MRISAGFIVAAIVLAGCQAPGPEPRPALQARLDSLQEVTRTLRQRVQRLQEAPEDSGAGTETALTPPIYFPSGSAWITDTGRQRLDAHARTLKQDSAGGAFRIQGYTDAVPIGDSLQAIYPSNWYLAAQRAAAVAHYLDRYHDVRSQGLKIEAFGPPPVETQGPPHRRPEKRRVEVVVPTSEP
jgi:chemotaxis protein MotB